MYKILISTDDYLMQEALKTMIKKDEKFEIYDIVSSSASAVKICKYEPINIVLLDINSIGVDAVEASRVINYRNPNIAIYIISHMGTSSSIWFSAKNYIKDVIERPVTNKDIANVLEKFKTENENSVQTYVNDLTEIILNNDFSRFYDILPEVIEKIYNIAKNDVDKLEKIFKYIGNGLLSIRNFYEDNIDVTEIFPINKTVISDPKISEMWLFKVVNYLFQRCSIDRYPLLENIFSYIDDNIKEKITLTDITDNCAISQGYLSRIFREQLGVSVMEYLHMRKIHLSKGYFYFTNDSIEDVAFKLGYTESSYFSKVFKKYEKKTVKQYKIENGKI